MRELKFADSEIVVSKTDTQGKITYGNALFLKLAGYSEKELLGAPHSIIRHPDMPKIIFKSLWDTIRQGKEIYAYVVNKSKNGDFYWVFANVTPSYNQAGDVVGYYSVRRKPSQKALNSVKPLYSKLLRAEKSGGIDESAKLLKGLLAQNGGRYDKFILSI